MKKSIGGIWKWFSTGILILVLASCFSAWTGDEGTISITVGGGGGGASKAVFDQEFILFLEHTIKLSNGPGPEQSLTHIKSGQTVNFMVLPGRWDISVKAYLDEKLYAAGIESVDVKPGQAAAISVQMKLAEKTFRVSFNSNDGSYVAQQEVIEGGNAERPANPVKSGHVFIGWFSDPGFTEIYDFETPVTADIILYARWLASEITARAMASINGGDPVPYPNLESAFASVGSLDTAVITALQDIPDQIPIEIDAGTRTITLVSMYDHTITLESAGSLITLNSGVTLKLGNSTSGRLTLRGIPGNSDALVSAQGGSLELNANIVITENKNNSGNGGGVYVGSTGNFTMNGGSINGNEALNGGGVYFEGESFEMRGGTIGGTANKADNGGGVYLFGGTAAISGGAIISNNEAASYGGGVHVFTSTIQSNFHIMGGVISGNSATYGGGGVYKTGGGVFAVRDGTISGNISAGNGGGVYLDNGPFTMSGGTIFGSSTYEPENGLHNTAALNGASLFVSSGATAEYDDALVTGAPVGISLIYNGGITYTNDTLPSTGEAAYPFKIYTETDLKMVGNTSLKSGWGLDKHYILMNDITLNNPVSPETSNWTPIGAPLGGNEFSGVFDGNCKTITGLTINEPLSANGQGMFGCIKGDGASTGVVKNLGLINVSIIISGFPGSYIGGLSGYNLLGGTVSNCYVTGTVSGDGYVGGLVGNNSGVVSNCYTTCEVSGQSENVGGIAGSNSGDVVNCYAAGNISGSATVGGVAGSNPGNIKNCAAINQSIAKTSGSMTSFGRITSGSTGGLENNYARYDMLVNSSLYDTDSAAVRDGMHGGNITSANWNNADWWIDNILFSTAVWQINDYALPILKGFTAAQNPKVVIIPNKDWYSESPLSFTISTAAQLAGLAELVNTGTDSFSGKTITLAADNDLSDFGIGNAAFNGGKGWIPIGYDYDHPFRGVFNGDGKTITGLYINDTTVTGYRGLFGSIDVGTVKNLGLMGVNINCAGSNIGGIAGQNRGGGSIENCFVTGTVNGTSASCKYIGGIAGHNENTSRVESCYTTCAVKGNESIGGIAGWNDKGSVQNCYATGYINGNIYIGGLVGYNDGSVINCYASGSVSGSNSVGGIAGFCLNGSVIVQNCVALNPSITASNANIGRVVGQNSGASLSGNKARSDMKAVTIEFSTDTNIETGKGGMNITVDNNAAFSSVFSGWSNAVWAFSPADNLRPGCNLPTLRNTAVPDGMEPTLTPAP